MLRIGIAYMASAIVLFGIDLIWLSRAMGFYRSELGDLLAERPNLPVAGLFYAIYIVGIVVFAVLPASRGGSWTEAVLLGGLLGLVAFATYDLTNLSTLRRWSTAVAMVDIGWGAFITSVASLAGYVAVGLLSPDP